MPCSPCEMPLLPTNTCTTTERTVGTSGCHPLLHRGNTAKEKVTLVIRPNLVFKAIFPGPQQKHSALSLVQSSLQANRFPLFSLSLCLVLLTLWLGHIHVPIQAVLRPLNVLLVQELFNALLDHRHIRCESAFTLINHFLDQLHV